ncbi:hypothetical protein C0058_13120 [Pseudomonas sp. NC02]|nr:hypothetical protein C0058_13120 [Pseudomonas sp. NC02]
MSICSRCGNTIEFRYVNGRCTPIHIQGACISAGNSMVTDYSGYTISLESTCFCTHCPICRSEVYFIRHNGGSVWIDPPLGPPWFKHACFEPDSNIKSTLLSASENHYHPTQNEIIGVVKASHVDNLKAYTRLTIETGKLDNINLKVKNNAGFLLGKLCVYEPASGRIWPAEAPSYIFGTDKWVNRKRKNLVKNNMTICPKCNKSIKEQNMKMHMRNIHGYI